MPALPKGVKHAKMRLLSNDSVTSVTHHDSLIIAETNFLPKDFEKQKFRPDRVDKFLTLKEQSTKVLPWKPLPSRRRHDHKNPKAAKLREIDQTPKWRSISYLGLVVSILQLLGKQYITERRSRNQSLKH